jgi:hypothetical protein
MATICLYLIATLCHAACSTAQDRPVLALAGALAAAQVADGITTAQEQRRGWVEVESRWILGERPSPARMAAVWGAQNVATALLADRMRHAGNKWLRRCWWIPQTISISVNMGSAVHNSRLK